MEITSLWKINFGGPEDLSFLKPWWLPILLVYGLLNFT